MESQTPANIATNITQNVVKKFPIFEGQNKAKILSFLLVVVLAGVGSGFLLSRGGGSLLGLTTQTAPGAKSGPMEAGLADEATFKDSAEGKVEEGGVNGEGTHHLARDGGPSQNVYLTSTVIDLQSFVGKKVKVWGQTIAGKKAGWLMDVGKVKVID